MIPSHPRRGGPDNWPPSEAQISAARDGDVDALGAVLGAGHPRLVAFFHGVGMPPDLVGEIVSDCLEGMIRAFPKLRDPAAFEGWFWAIARNRMRTAIRRHRSKRIPTDAFVSPSTPEEIVMISSEHSLIRSALDSLTARDRELLWLREVEDLEYHEIGTRIGASVGTVRVACHRARKRLEQAYAELEGP